jgi:hypothetical protein
VSGFTNQSLKVIPYFLAEKSLNFAIDDRCKSSSDGVQIGVLYSAIFSTSGRQFVRIELDIN